jgi:uncharacterized protein GlcG (DUF336 family)
MVASCVLLIFALTAVAAASRFVASDTVALRGVEPPSGAAARRRRRRPAGLGVPRGGSFSAPDDDEWLAAPSAPKVLTLRAADAMCDAAIAESARFKNKPVSVLVVDANGRVLVSKTMLGTPLLIPEMARAKAGACVAMHCSSRSLAVKYNPSEEAGSSSSFATFSSRDVGLLVLLPQAGHRSSWR